MATLKIDDNWHIVDDAVANRMQEMISAHNELINDFLRLVDLHKTAIVKPMGSLINLEDYWSEYCKENNINY